MDDKLDSVMQEYEKVTGKSGYDSSDTKQTYFRFDNANIYVPIVIFFVLIATRPNFLYIKSDIYGDYKFSAMRLIVFTCIISTCVLVLYYLHKSKKLF